MERIEALINKLKEQFEQGADISKLRHTVHMLQSELAQVQQGESRQLGTSKVAVVLPKNFENAVQQEKENHKSSGSPAVQEIKETVLVEDDAVSRVQKNGQLDMVFDPLREIPTLSHQLQEKKISESSSSTDETLNDRLRHGKAELMEILRETPVKDLRKAVGINDRFLFVNELFRGDESMYERSIKTINNFSIYPEAEYWINRELKVKLAWDENTEIVKQFYQLVKRRFS